MTSLWNRYHDVPEHLRLERCFELASVALLAVALMLSVLVVVSMLRPAQVDQLVPSADSILVETPHVAESVSAQGSFEIRARPLFWSTRRPDESVELELVGLEPEQAEALGPLAFDVNGVFGSGESGGFIATMRGEVMRLRVGDTIEGWRVAAINPTNVELVGGDTRRVVPLAQRPISRPQEAPAPTEPDNGNAVSEAPAPSSRPRAVDLSRLSLGGAPAPVKQQESGSKETR